MKSNNAYAAVKVVFLFSFLAFLFASPSFAQSQLNVKKHTLSGKKFERKMQKKNAFVLDVRTADEFKAGHLSQAVNMDVLKDDFNKKIENLDKSKTYLIYCKSGRRSERALKILDSAGFQKVFHLKDGYTGWRGKTVE